MDDTAIMRAVPRTGPAPRREGARPKLPLPALVLVVGVIACGVAAIAIRIPEVMAWTPRDLWAYLGLAGAISVVELFPLRFRHATEVQYLSLTDALWAAGILALGVTVAVVWERAPLALPLLSVPLALSYYAYRAWLSEAARRDRMRTLYQASLALSGPLDASLNMRPFLSITRRLLEAEAAEIVVVRGDTVAIHSEEGTESLVAGSGNGSVRPQAYVRVRDGVSPQVAVVGGPDDVRGVLALYRREPLSEADRSLLDALASQVRLRLINQRLYAEILDERTGIADVIAHAPDGVFVLSDDDRIVSWNPAMERLAGRPAAEVVGKAWEEVFGPPDTVRRTDVDDDERESILLGHPDGGERWVRCRRAPLRDRSGSVTGTVVTVP